MRLCYVVCMFRFRQPNGLRRFTDGQFIMRFMRWRLFGCCYKPASSRLWTRMHRRLCGFLMFSQFNLFGISIPSYFAMAVIGFCCALTLAYYRNLKISLNWGVYYLSIVTMTVAMVIGGKLVFVITEIPDIIADFSFSGLLIRFIDSGIVFYGGLYGAVLGGYIFARISRINTDKLFNLFMPSVVLFHAFGRIGCLLAGCCYGIECAFGITYPNEPGVIRFPVQPIESLCEFAILAILLAAEKKYPQKIRMLPLYLVLYASVRFILEFFRGDEIRGTFGGISTSQWISLITIAAAILIAISKRRKIQRQKNSNCNTAN